MRACRRARSPIGAESAFGITTGYRKRQKTEIPPIRENGRRFRQDSSCELHARLGPVGLIEDDGNSLPLEAIRCVLSRPTWPIASASPRPRQPNAQGSARAGIADLQSRPRRDHRPSQASPRRRVRPGISLPRMPPTLSRAALRSPEQRLRSRRSEGAAVDQVQIMAGDQKMGPGGPFVARGLAQRQLLLGSSLIVSDVLAAQQWPGKCLHCTRVAGSRRRGLDPG